MTTIRRLYLYLSTFIGMSLTLAGVFALISLLVEQGFDAFRNFAVPGSAVAVAQIIAGGITWRFYWRLVQREADALLDERASGLRKLYLYGTLAISLLGALILIQQVLAELLVRLLGAGLNGYKPWTPLLIAAVLGGVWLWHKRIADSEQAAGAHGTRGGDLQRGYWLALTLFGVNGAASGASAFIAGLLSHLGGRAPSVFGFSFGESTWVQTLIPPLVQLLVSGFAVWLFWLPSQKAAVSGNEAERASRTRWALIHLVVFWASIWALGGAQGVLADGLSRALLRTPGELLVLTVNQPLSLLIVGGLLLLYFYREVRPTLASPRPSEYLITGTAFFIAIATTLQLVGMLLNTLGGQGARVENLIVNVLPGLLVGSLVWRWRWRELERHTADPTSVGARSDVWRKVYLHFYQLIGLLLMLAGGVAILQQIITSLLGRPSFGNALVEQSTQLALLIVGGGVMIYMLQVIASDARLGALSVEDAMRQTLGDTVPTWAIAAAVGLIVGPFSVIVLLALLGPVIGNIFNNIISRLN